MRRGSAPYGDCRGRTHRDVRVALAAIVYFAQRISTFVQVFVATYALGYLRLAAGSLAAALGILPQGLAEMLPPPFSASAAVVFAGLIYGASFLRVIRTITAMTR